MLWNKMKERPYFGSLKQEEPEESTSIHNLSAHRVRHTENDANLGFRPFLT